MTQLTGLHNIKETSSNPSSAHHTGESRVLDLGHLLLGRLLRMQLNGRDGPPSIDNSFQAAGLLLTAGCSPVESLRIKLRRQAPIPRIFLQILNLCVRELKGTATIARASVARGLLNQRLLRVPTTRNSPYVCADISIQIMRLECVRIGGVAKNQISQRRADTHFVIISRGLVSRCTQLWKNT